jgi:hypothetical protein
MKIPGQKTNFRVTITPRRFGDFGMGSVSDNLLYGADAKGQLAKEKDYISRCEEIARQAKRHCDDVDSAEVSFDQESVCSHCGHLWTEESTVYNGGCCEADEVNKSSL